MRTEEERKKFWVGTPQVDLIYPKMIVVIDGMNRVIKVTNREHEVLAKWLEHSNNSHNQQMHQDLKRWHAACSNRSKHPAKFHAGDLGRYVQEGTIDG